MNNKIVSIKRNSAIFLATVLLAGTIAAFSSSSFMVGAQAEPYYGGMDNNYDKSSEKDNYESKDNNKIVKKIKCNNINVNVNGLELDGLPPFLTGLVGNGERDEGQYGASSYGSGTGSYGNVGQSGYDNNSLKFVCINNNNNTVIVGGGEAPPIPPTTTLTVIKQITCEDETEGDCDDLLTLITEDDFRFQVEGNNPDPSTTFPGSPTGTVVTLGPGDFNVTEIIPTEENEDITTFLNTHPDRGVSRAATFIGDCTISEAFINNGDTFLIANGTIAAGEAQTCIATNAYEIFGSSFSTPIIAQGTEDSSPAYKIFTPSISTTTSAQGTEDSSPASELTALEKQSEDSHQLTATEKITKLKTQWLDLLP